MILRSYGRCSGRMSALVLLKTSANSWYSGGTPERSGGVPETDVARPRTDVADRLRVKLSEPGSLQARAKAAALTTETWGMDYGALQVGVGGVGSGGAFGDACGTGSDTGRVAGAVRKCMLRFFQSINGL